jgi:hypothetical protein
LRLDDFVYVARSRALASLVRHLLTPHNGHVVPLFLLETHFLARCAGSLARLPAVLGCAGFVNLTLAMASAGHLVAWETGRATRGLAAMAAVGLSSVLAPAFLFYAASQALAAGTAILVMLAALQAWRAGRSWWWLALAIGAAMAAPLFWTAGYTAGLVGLAYLWSDRRRSYRIAAMLPPAASVATAAVVWGLEGPAIAASARLAERPPLAISDLPVVLGHIAQAVVEKLVLNNFGLDALAAPAQSVVLCFLLLGAWALTRGGRWPVPNPLETAGAMLVFANFGLIFALRGTRMTYDGLRALGWYDAIPQLGAVLFAAGWWSGRIDSPPPRSLAPPRARELALAAGFAGVVLLLQSPRAERVIFLYDGMATEVRLLDQPAGPRVRSPGDLASRGGRQRQALASLDQLEQEARASGLDRATLRRVRRVPEVPGMPDSLPDLNALDLLNLAPEPRKGGSVNEPRRGPPSADQ